MLREKRKIVSTCLALMVAMNIIPYFNISANAVTVNNDTISNEKSQNSIKSTKNINEVTNTNMSLQLMVKNVENIEGDMNIISSPLLTKEQAKEWARKCGATDTFISLADLYWIYYKDHGNVNPVIAYVQAAKETGYGKFGGVLNESYHNPCGLKNSAGGSDTDPNAHHRFNSWDEGVQAHLDHLALYSGANGYPRQNTLDPRHFLSIKGKAKKVSELGGNWAPSKKYGTDIIDMYNKIKSIPKHEDISSGSIDKKENVKTGWILQNHHWHYLDQNGVMEKGWISYNSNWYYLDENGQMQTGWKTIDGICYYLNNSGVMEKEWLSYDGKWYYLYKNGAKAVNTVVDGWVLDQQGVATPTHIRNNWLFGNNSWYYIEQDGQPAKEWKSINGKWYYMNELGIMQKGWILLGDNWYYLNNSGDMLIGWLFYNNQWYYLESNGVMATNKVVDGWKINGSGIATLDQSNVTDTSKNPKSKWISENNHWYYYNENGNKATGWNSISGHWYYMNNDGVMKTGWLTDNGIKYYLNSDGAMQIGWLLLDNWYYFNNNGSIATNTTVDGWNIDGNGIARKNQKLVVVDAGHNYGGDDGAYSTINGVKYSERDLNMKVAVKLQNELTNKGYKVVMTRQPWEMLYEDSTTSLKRRADLANDLNADLFISLHHDSSGASAHGTTAYYSSYKIPLDKTGNDFYWGHDPHGYDGYDVMLPNHPTSEGEKSEKFASHVIKSLSSNTGLLNRGFHDRSLSVTAHTKMPSVLIELGFITNPEEAVECANDNAENIKARTIANEVKDMF